MAGVDEQRLGVALAQWRAQGNVLPRVWTKAGALVRQEGNIAMGVPPSAGRSPAGRAIVRDYTAEGAKISFADSFARLGLSKDGSKPPLAGLRIHDPNDSGGSTQWMTWPRPSRPTVCSPASVSSALPGRLGM